ncbi:hypothetical protein PWY87_09660 [Kribbella solani]|uniref:hypothetical protein n=1 Tax=Kribbella solani TaxID=236067 RepID=UPI0029AF4784|nr:hypothetical protein [Kribbella solani]MDX2972136.1 hypothetical protein [Kribbella solani]MDX3001933.1 hypothetical protein [Kribbella solani]
MKQPKGSRADHRTTPDRRPAKPPAGETRRRHAAVAPYAGPVKADPSRPEQSGAGKAESAGTERVVRREPGRAAKPAFDHEAAATARPGEHRAEQQAGGAPGQPPQQQAGAAAGRSPGGGWGDQVAVESARGGVPAEQYVRLRIRVRGDRLTVVDSHLVDGPLAQSAAFQGANAYEVTYQDRLLHAGTVADPNTQRSFPNPDGPAEQRGHNVTPREVYEFIARVPAADVTPDTRTGIRVRLHQIQEPTTTDRLGVAPLAAQFEGRLTPVAELVGLPESALPEAIDARGGRTATGS